MSDCYIPYFYVSSNFSACMTVSNEPCETDPWVWNEGIIGKICHFRNCVPMFGDGGRYIYDLKANPSAVRGVDYDYYCPVSLEKLKTDPLDHGMISQSTPNYFNSLKVCKNLDVDTHCISNVSLEEAMSPGIGEGRNV